MKPEISKQAQIELKALVRHLENPHRKQLPGIPPEDLMEIGADLLDDSWSRGFFMTVTGFARLVQLFTEPGEFPHQKVLSWLTHRFPNIHPTSEIEEKIDLLVRASLPRPNLNITLKRLTAILTLSERATMAEGVLDLLFADGQIPPEKMTLIESTFSRILMSENAAAEFLDHWQKQHKPASLPLEKA